MKRTTAILILSAVSSHGVTVFSSADNALASASWDTFTFESPVAGESGTHGAAQGGSGALVSSSDLTSETIAAYDKPPGGFNSNPDTYYLHNGGATWTVTAGLSSEVAFVRVSYALLGFGQSAPEAFIVAPEISGAILINSGSYATENSQVFFSDFELGSASDNFTSSFGDTAIGQSFRSIDAVQFEVFDSVPVPEPSTVFLSGLAALGLMRRRRIS
ncbi:PEP-CTERM sorting domain-containing protein [Verrucomicrobiaceae bacterium 227]